MKSKITICLATYNGAPFLQRQLDSLRLQTYFIDEIIICDDCSQDNTYSILSEYIAQYDLKNWQLFSNTERLGYAKNFYQLLSKSSGDYIFLCDQDDLWFAQKVERIIEFFESDTNIQCINTAFRCIDENDRLIDDTFSFLSIHCMPKELVKISFEYILRSNIAMGCTMAFRKEIKDIYIQMSSRIAAHDWELNTIAALCDGLYYLNEELLGYRLHSNNTTGIDKFSKKILWYEKRRKNAVEMNKFISSLEAYKQLMGSNQIKVLQSKTLFYQKRLELVTYKKVKNWFWLIRHINIYHQIVSFKGMILDLFCGFVFK